MKAFGPRKLPTDEPWSRQALDDHLGHDGEGGGVDDVDGSVAASHIGDVRIAVLGPLRVDGGHTRLTPRDRVVLEALTLRAGDAVASDWLCDALWGETQPPTATKALQGCIGRLRKVLGADAIET